MRERLPLPAKIREAPSLFQGLELYYDAFLELSSCRFTGFALGPIPWTAMRDYAEAFELDEEQKDDLFYFVRAMDVAYLEHQARRK